MVNIQLYNNDCLLQMQSIPDKSIDLICCDLPYGVTACEWDTIIPFDKLWEQYNRIIKPTRAIVLTATQPFSSALVMSNVKNFKHEWIWDKITGIGFQIANHRPMQQHEHVLVFANGATYYKPQMSKMRKSIPSRVYNMNYNINYNINHNRQLNRVSNTIDYIAPVRTHYFPKSILTISYGGKVNLISPTQKPVDLFRYLIKTYSDEGDTVLDNCMGSGTTGVACIKENRKFIGIEMNKTYFEAASKRIDETQPYINFNE